MQWFWLFFISRIISLHKSRSFIDEISLRLEVVGAVAKDF